MRWLLGLPSAPEQSPETQNSHQGAQSHFPPTGPVTHEPPHKHDSYRSRRSRVTLRMSLGSFQSVSRGWTLAHQRQPPQLSVQIQMYQPVVRQMLISRVFHLLSLCLGPTPAPRGSQLQQGTQPGSYRLAHSRRGCMCPGIVGRLGTSPCLIQ